MKKKDNLFKFTLKMLKPLLKYKMASANNMKLKKGGHTVPMSKALLLSKYKKYRTSLCGGSALATPKLTARAMIAFLIRMKRRD